MVSIRLQRIAGYRAPLPPHRAQPRGAEGSRTLGLCVANAALSQLSYGPYYPHLIIIPLIEYVNKGLTETAKI